MKHSVFSYLPGLCWVLIIAALSTLLSQQTWFELHAISALTLAIIIGMSIGNGAPFLITGDRAAGIDFAKQTCN